MTRQKEVFLTLMENYDSAQKYAETSANAFGTANEKYEIYMDSVMAKQNQLRASWEEFYNNLLNSDFIKTLLNIANTLLKLMNLGDGFVGKLTLAMTALAGFNMVFKSDLKVFESLRAIFAGLGGAVGSLITSVKALTASGRADIAVKQAQILAQKGLNEETAKGNAIALANPWLAIAEIVTIAVLGIVTAVKKHNEAIQESIDKAQELKDTYKSTSDEISDNIKSLTETTSVKSDGTEYKSLQEEFDALCKGVDRYGNNLSLTNEEYSRYKSICEQIVGLNPDLMEGYNNEIEAIGNKNNKLQDTIDLLREEQKQKAKEYVNSSDETLEGAQSKYRKDTKDAKDTLDLLANSSTWKDINVQISNALSLLKQQVPKSVDTSVFAEINNSSVERVANNWNDYKSRILESKKQILESTKLSDKDKNWVTRNIDDYISNIETHYVSRYNEAKDTIDEANKELANSMNETWKAVLKSSDNYENLDSNTKSWLNKYVSENFKVDENTTEEVKNQYIKDIQSILDSISGDSIDAENARKGLSELFSLDPDDISYDEYKKKVEEVVDLISKVTGQDKDKIMISLGFDVDTDELKGLDGENEIIDKLSSKFGESVDEVKSKLGDMSKSSVDALLKMDDSVLQNCKSWDDLKVAIENAKNSIETVTFDSAMSDYANGLQNLQTQYETLSKAQEEYNEYGNLTASTMKKIIDGGLLDYLTVVDGQLRFNTQGLQDNANALQENAIAQLQTALYTDLNSIAQGTYQDTINSTDTSGANSQLQMFRTELGKTTDSALTTAGAISAMNSAMGTNYNFSDKQKEQADKVVANYNNMVTKVKALTTNLSAGTYRSKKSSGSSGSKGSSSTSTKSAEEKQFDSLKDKFQADEITINQYISGMQSILKKVKKGSDLYNKIQEELKKQKLNNVKKQYQYGEITIDEYINKLTDLRDEYKYNTEGYKELTETINKTKADKWADQYERASISLETYTRNLANLRDEYKRNSEEWKKYNDLINKTKLEKYDDQYDRGEINYNTYIKRLTALRKSYYIDSETYKDISKKITDAYIDNLEKGLDDIDTAIDKLGSVNTAKEQSEYANLLSKKYNLVKSDISDIQRQLRKNNLTTEQRITLQGKLNDLIKEEVDIHDEIEDKVRDYYENQKDYLEKQAELQKKQVLYNKELELYGSQGKELWEYYQDKQIEALEKERDLNEENNDLLEAKLKLQNALNNKTTKILTKQDDGTWAYTFSANMVAVKEAQKELREAELNAKIDALQKEKDEKDKAYSDAEFWANRDYEKQMNSIANSFGDIDKLVQDWMKKYGNNTNAYIKLVEHSNELDQELVDIATKIEAKYETVGTNGVIKTKNGVTSFDTGGEVSGSGLALVHDKERVLTKEQNISFLKLLKNLDNLNSIIDISKINIPKSKLIKDITSKDKNGQTIINGVTCVFPNINSTEGLQQAILDLPRLALQQK